MGTILLYERITRDRKYVVIKKWEILKPSFIEFRLVLSTRDVRESRQKVVRTEHLRTFLDGMRINSEIEF